MSKEAGRDQLRAGEVATTATLRADASVTFIGRIRTPFLTRADCPRQGDLDGPICRLEIDETWRGALQGLAGHTRVEILYWLHQSRRDVLLQNPRSDGQLHGTFALRSPVRPNPIGTSLCCLVGVEDNAVLVRGLDCLDGTPLLDIKPERCHHSRPVNRG